MIYLLAILILLDLVLCIAVWAVYAGHNAMARRLSDVEVEQLIHTQHLKNHAQKLDARPELIRLPVIRGRR